MAQNKWKHYVKATWHFLWHDDSIWSWLANLAVAFVLIRFIVYPILAIIFGTGFPIVAVVSESMEHGLHDNILCGQQFSDFKESYDNYWKTCGAWYEQHSITKEQFQTFTLNQGFRKGDVILIWRANTNNIHLGDILIFRGDRPQPIIHRVIKIWEQDGQKHYQTKGDHNSNSITGNYPETDITIDRIYGKATLRIPYLGWVKILFVQLLAPFGIVIER